MFREGDIVLIQDIDEMGFCMRRQLNIESFPVPAVVVEVMPEKIYVNFVHPEPRMRAGFHRWNFRERHFEYIELMEEA